MFLSSVSKHWLRVTQQRQKSASLKVGELLFFAEDHKQPT